MDKRIEMRTLVEAQYILEKNTTVRATAKHFGVSKTTVHNDFTKRLENIDAKLYKEVIKLLEFNKSVRHIRGGDAIKRKYAREQSK